jgi:Leucine-rich repeat (LRR) protein/antitoxin component YwqK of YwqJK toxin-antitoxin module
MKRPASVPEAAHWSAKDNEWILGPKDDKGEFHGDVSYWRPDGTLVCVCPHEHGKPHGVSKRFHESGEVSRTAEFVMGVLHGPSVWLASTSDQPTTEKMHSPGMSKSITRAEVSFTHGKASAFRYFDKEGRELEVSGTPLPIRPPGVPEGALFRKNGATWIAATFLENGDPDGRSRSFDTRGALIAEEHFKEGKRHGLTTFYDFRGDGAKRAAMSYADGTLDGELTLFWPNGTLRRRTRFTRDVLSAPIEDWDASGALLPAIEIPPIGDAPQVTSDPKAKEMAELIAAGWGGSDERDAAEARAARALVRETAPPSLWAKMTELGLDRAPRLMTEARVEKVIAALADQIDRNALSEALIAQGGSAFGVALSRGGAGAVTTLESRRSGKRRERMVLAGLGLQDAPPSLARFPTVEELDLSHNRLDTVPRELGAMVGLRKLELGDNQIRSLPHELARLGELRSLHLNDNGLESVPDGLCALRGLETLNLGDNAITSLPPEIGDLDQLHTVWLHDNPLTTLPREITRWKRLSFLHLGNMAWEEPPACLFEMTWLEELWLAGHELKRLPPEIGRLTNLRQLCLWYSGLESVPDELYRMTHLTELRIKNNPMPDEIVERLEKALPGCTIY